MRDARRALLLVMVSVAGCTDRRDGDDPSWLAITRANSALVASVVSGDNGHTDASNFMPEAFQLLDDFLPIVALEPSGARIDLPCAVAGKVVLTGAVAEPSQAGWTPGDHVTAEYEGCRNDSGPFGEVIDGESRVVVLGAEMEDQIFEASQVDWTATVEDLGSVTVNGASTVTRSLEAGIVTLSAETAKSTASGDLLNEVVLDHTARLVDFGDTFELSYAGTLDGDRLGGAVRYETVVAFTGPEDGYPLEGELLVTGEGGSNVRVTALAAEEVRLGTDEDGDGVVDPNGTQVMTWWDLEDVQ